MWIKMGLELRCIIFFYLSGFQSKSTVDLYSFVHARRLVVVIDDF